MEGELNGKWSSKTDVVVPRAFMRLLMTHSQNSTVKPIISGDILSP